MTPSDKNRFLAEKVMKWDYCEPDLIGNPACYVGYPHDEVEFEVYEKDWNPGLDWNQLMLCQEVAMREKPVEYINELFRIVILDSGMGDWIPEYELKIKILLLSATREQQTDAMIKCYDI